MISEDDGDAGSADRRQRPARGLPPFQPWLQKGWDVLALGGPSPVATLPKIDLAGSPIRFARFPRCARPRRHPPRSPRSAPPIGPSGSSRNRGPRRVNVEATRVLSDWCGSPRQTPGLFTSTDLVFDGSRRLEFARTIPARARSRLWSEQARRRDQPFWRPRRGRRGPAEPALSGRPDAAGRLSYFDQDDRRSSIGARPQIRLRRRIPDPARPRNGRRSPT